MIVSLFHPDGVANRAVVLGSQCPPVLRFGLDHPKSDSPALSTAKTPRSPRGKKHLASLASWRFPPLVDAAIVAPTPGEAAERDWLDQAFQSISRVLAEDGLVYVLVPPRMRARAQRALARHGLIVEMAILHLPDWATSRYVIPLTPLPATYAFGSLMPTPHAKRQFTNLLIRAPLLRRWLVHLHPSVALLARRPGSRPAFDWLYRPDGESGQPRGVTVCARWRPGHASYVLHRFAGQPQPSAVAKLVWDERCATTSEHEIEVLGRLGSAGRGANVNVPEVLASAQLGQRRVFLQSALRGRTAAAVLTEQPGRQPEILERVTSWLEAWNRATRIEGGVNGAEIARSLLPGLRDPAYSAWLAQRLCAMTHVAPSVATHNDLTMWNVLIDGAGRLGVVDWAEACDAGVPLADWWYALLDAAVISRRITRVAAMAALFGVHSVQSTAAAQHTARLIRAMALSPSMAEACLHATFVGHAANEARDGVRPGPNTFQGVVDWLAANRLVAGQWLAALA